MANIYSEARLPTASGVFRLRIYERPHHPGTIAILNGEELSAKPIVRIHTACFISENLGCLGCSCREHLHFALRLIGACGGIVVYLRRDSAGRGLADQIRKGTCWVTDHPRLDRAGFEAAAMVLRDLDVQSVRLLTDDTVEAEGITEFGISVACCLPMHATADGSMSLADSIAQPALVLSESLDSLIKGLPLGGRAPLGGSD